MTAATLQERLDQVDKNGRFWKSVCAFLVCATAGILCLGDRLFQGSGIVSLRELRILDEQGGVKAKFLVDDRDDARLNLLNNQGESVVDLRTGPYGGSTLELRGNAYGGGLDLAALSDGTSTLALYDSHRLMGNALYSRPQLQTGLFVRTLNPKKSSDSRLASHTDQVRDVSVEQTSFTPKPVRLDDTKAILDRNESNRPNALPLIVLGYPEDWSRL